MGKFQEDAFVVIDWFLPSDGHFSRDSFRQDFKKVR